MPPSPRKTDYWRRALVAESASIRDAIEVINEAAMQIAMVVDADNRLLGTVTDGDIRRGLLRDLALSSPVSEVVQKDAFVVQASLDTETVLGLMQANNLRQLPIVDADKKVTGLHLWDEIIAPPKLPNMMVIMAGGLGTRLRPHTEHCPKPLLPVAGKPMLQHIIENARAQGFSRFVLAINYLGEMIEDHFGDGSALQVKIEYLREETPLGTAGALALIDPVPEHPFIVTNGDVLSDINYADLLAFHRRHGGAATMAVRLHEWQHPFGVVQMQGEQIIGFEEKPIARSHINAGIYALDPATLALLPNQQRCDMPTLFSMAQAGGEKTIAYPMHEPWLDVGREEDFTRAQSGLQQHTSDDP